MKAGNGCYILRLTVVLLLITVITAGLLGLVNEVTADKIAALKKQKTDAAMAQVLQADSYIEITDYADETGLIDQMYEAGSVGYVLQATCSGSQGMITIMVGVGTDGKVTGISIIDQSETPGLGAVYAQDSEKGSRFRESFQTKGENLAVGDIDYISGATVSAAAICNGVNAATACVAAYQNEKGDVS